MHITQLLQIGCPAEKKALHICTTLYFLDYKNNFQFQRPESNW
jgi:hypothetical protein